MEENQTKANEQIIPARELDDPKEMTPNDFGNAVNESVNGALKGLQEQINDLKNAIGDISAKQKESAKSDNDDFCKCEKCEDCTMCLNGAVTGETGRETPDKRVDFSKLSYSELCSFLEKHPRAKL